MQIVLITVGILLAIAVILVIYGFSKPRKTYMKRSVEINASKEKVFEYANNLQKFVENWSPWTEKDPNMETNYNDVPEGVGSQYSWKGHPKKVGFGTMEIIVSEPNTKVESILNFGGRGDANVTLHVRPITEGRMHVTWDFTSDAGNNPAARIFGAMMDRFLGPDFENGLKKLKETCEK
jgi:uncharacterized protein YndB with AHSA1/START domain